MNYTANILLAVGAIPSMSIDPEEICDFVSSANALLINLGTLSNERKDSMVKAIDTACTQHKPWVLDPVFVNRSPLRLALAHQLVKQKPSVVRANAEEIKALFNDYSTTNKLAQKIETVIARTGQPDIVSDGNATVQIFNGHELMSRVTGLGCAMSALVTAFASVTDNTLDATTSALLVMGIAGEIAAESANGPGRLQNSILDTLYNLNGDQIIQRSNIE